MSSGGAIMFGVKSFTFSFAALLMATGCNQKPSETADNGEATNISGNAMDTQSKSESNASGLASDLGAYVGKHPSEKVADLTFLEQPRSEEHTSELQSLMRNSYAVFCLKKKNN